MSNCSATRASLICLLLLFSAPPSAAQSFTIDETSLADGASAVPLETTIRFEFDDAVDQQTNLNLAFMIVPRHAVRISRVALIPDEPQRDCPSLPPGRVCPSVIEYTVTHEPETDYTWLAYAIQTPGGKQMTEPYVLRYTTASTSGHHSITGDVTTATASSRTAADRETLRRLVMGLRQKGLGRPVFDETLEAAKMNAAGTTAGADALQLAGPHTLVLLIDGFTTTEPAWDIQAATVIPGTTGSYDIDELRPATHYPIAVRYTDGTRREIEALGYYDADDNGTPDAVDVDAGDLSGINIAMQPFTLASAQEHMALARDSAARHAGDQQLLGVRATSGARPAGTAYTWRYHFYSASEGLHTLVDVDPLQATTSASAAPEVYAAYVPVPADFVDSDVALQHVRDAGGTSFLEGYPPENTSTVIRGGPVYSRPEEGEAFWNVQLFTFTSTRVDDFEAFVNMTSGEVTRTALEEHERLTATPRLAPPYPQPFTTHATLPFELDRPSRVSVDVFDVLGRRVATLVDERQPAGRNEVTFDARDLPSGLYLVRLEADGRTATRRLTLVR